MASRTNRLPRWLKILPGVILLGALLVAAGAALFLRASLPRLDGDVRAPTLGGPMTIERDAAGVPTVAARDRFDAAYGIGYLHAQDRFFQMDYLRRTGAGDWRSCSGPPRWISIASTGCSGFARAPRRRSRSCRPTSGACSNATRKA
ncbi:penicillin amidase family protein [Burkholderia pseudomallei MSHR435]|nr:penicillin amidase family protein [Burkholderia pseudomallei MSHR435]